MANSTSTQMIAEVPVEVLAGQTVVLEIKASGMTEATETGRIELSLVDEAGAAVAIGPVYLVSEDGKRSYTIQIDMNANSATKGCGALGDIIPGAYVLSLVEPQEPAEPVAEPDSTAEAVKLDQVVYFDEDSYELEMVELKTTKKSISADAVINEIAAILSQENSRIVQKMYCVGFTNNIGSAAYNQKLSFQRATAVKTRLQELLKQGSAGTNREQPDIIADGRGSISGDSPEDLEKNRRVEIWLHRPSPQNIYQDAIPLKATDYNRYSSIKYRWTVVPGSGYNGPEDAKLVDYVKEFQKQAGLTEDGKIGKNTLAALWEAVRTKGPSDSNDAKELSISISERLELYLPSANDISIMNSILAEGNIIQRSVWGKKYPHYEKIRNDWNYHTVVLHHTGNWLGGRVITGVALPTDVEDHHMDDRGWDDIGYHYMVSLDGKVYEARKLIKRGAHTSYRNISRIGILALGDFHHQWWDPGDDDPSAALALNIVNLINLLRKHIPGIAKIGGHRDFTDTDDAECPGDKLYARLAEIRQATGLGSV